jgi:hypothetical protein
MKRRGYRIVGWHGMLGGQSSAANPKQARSQAWHTRQVNCSAYMMEVKLDDKTVLKIK